MQHTQPTPFPTDIRDIILLMGNRHSPTHGNGLRPGLPSCPKPLAQAQCFPVGSRVDPDKKQVEREGRVAAQLVSVTEEFHKLQVQSDKQRRQIRRLEKRLDRAHDKLDTAKDKIATLSAQNMNGWALAKKEKKQRIAAEQQLQNTLVGFQEIKMLMKTNQEQLIKELKEHQASQHRPQRVHKRRETSQHPSEMPLRHAKYEEKK